MFNIKQGFSLLEMLVTLSIIIILLAISFPTLQIFLTQTEDSILCSQLTRAIQLARNEANTRNEKVMLCKSSDLKTCGGDWLNGYIILSQDKLIYSFKNITKKGVLHWRARAHRDYLEFSPEGYTNNINGSFWYCANDTSNPVWAITVSKTGLSRVLYPNIKGVILDGHGDPYECYT